MLKFEKPLLHHLKCRTLVLRIMILPLFLSIFFAIIGNNFVFMLSKKTKNQDKININQKRMMDRSNNSVRTLKGFVFLMSCFCTIFLTAQVGIGTNSPSSKAVLELNSTTKGLLFPRLSGVQMSAIASPPAGLTVYNIDSACLCTYNGGQWVNLCGIGASAGGAAQLLSISVGKGSLTLSNGGGTVLLADSSSTNELQSLSIRNDTLFLSNGGFVKLPVLDSTNQWKLNGNMGSNASTNFIGTLDNQPISFRTKNMQWMQLRLDGGLHLRDDSANLKIGEASGNGITTGKNNVFLGKNAGLNNSSGSSNLALGNSSLQSNTVSSGNVAIGDSAGFSANNGSYNVHVGVQSGLKNSIGYYNSSLGYRSLQFSLTDYNTAIGARSLQKQTIGQENTAVGSFALAESKVASYNVAVGANALEFDSMGNGNVGVGWGAVRLNKKGNYNVGVGQEALYYSNRGTGNVAIGTNALHSQLNADANTGIGYAALANNIKGIANVAIGAYANFRDTASYNSVAIGYQAMFGDPYNTGKRTFHNIAIGNAAHFYKHNSNYNISLGNDAMYDNSNINFNIAIGHRALQSAKYTSSVDSIRTDNIAIGHSSQQGTSCFTSSNVNYGFRNTSVGNASLYGNYGSDNIALGDSAMFGGVSSVYNFRSIAIGNKTMKLSGRISGTANNIALGHAALSSNSTGSYNVAIGVAALASQIAASGNIAIGDSALANTTSAQNTGIGYAVLKKNSTGSQITAVGYQALERNDYGSENTAIGNQAQKHSQSASFNTSVGVQSLYNTQNGSNTAMGYVSMYSNTTGINNAAFGIGSLYSNLIGTHNTASGSMALYSSKRGSFNTALGDSALFYDTSFVGFGVPSGNTGVGASSLANNRNGTYNSAVGYRSLYKNTEGIKNTAHGYLSLYLQDSGSGNTAVGYSALYSNRKGNNNVAIGHNAALLSGTSRNDFSLNVALGSSSGYNNGYTGATGFANTLLGANSDIYSYLDTTNYSTAVGYNARVNGNNKIVLGRVSSNLSENPMVGVGMVSPKARLHIYSQDTAIFRLQGGIAWGPARIEFYSDAVGSFYEWRPAYIESIDSSGGTFTGGLKFMNNIKGSQLGVQEVMRYQNNRVGIGTTNPTQKLHVVSNLRNAGHFQSGTTIAASNSTFGAALFGEATQTSTASDVAGVYGKSTSVSGYGFGGYFIGNYYGLYAAAGPSSASGALYVNGNFTGTGTNSYTSDARLKKNVESLKIGLDIIMSLKPKSYEFDTSFIPGMNLPKGENFGFIAQEVSLLVPQLVVQQQFPAYKGTNQGKYLALNYQGLIPILTKAVQEQQQMIEQLSIQNALLLKRLEKIEAGPLGSSQ